MLEELKGLPIDCTLAAHEPDDLDADPSAPPARSAPSMDDLKKDTYFERLEGAFLGAVAGCALRAPVEFWSIDKMAALAEENGDDFPPTDYWSYGPEHQAEAIRDEPPAKLLTPRHFRRTGEDDTIRMASMTDSVTPFTPT